MALGRPKILGNAQKDPDHGPTRRRNKLQPCTFQGVNEGPKTGQNRPRQASQSFVLSPETPQELPRSAQARFPDGPRPPSWPEDGARSP
eukprot:8275693-Pyramimonas_sp.AAC.1